MSWYSFRLASLLALSEVLETPARWTQEESHLFSFCLCLVLDESIGAVIASHVVRSVGQ